MKSELLIGELDDIIEKLKLKIIYLETEIKELKKRILGIKQNVKNG